MLEHASQRQRGCSNDEPDFNSRRLETFVDRYAPTAGASAYGNEKLVFTDGGKIRDKSITVLKQFRHSFDISNILVFFLQKEYATVLFPFAYGEY